MNFLLRFVLTALAGYLITYYQPDIQNRDQAATLLAAVAIALFNAFLKPFKIVRKQPFTIYTLAIIITVVNILLVKLCDRYIPGFDVHGWGVAVLTGLAMTVVNFITNWLVGGE